MDTQKYLEAHHSLLLSTRNGSMIEAVARTVTAMVLMDYFIPKDQQPTEAAQKLQLLEYCGEKIYDVASILEPSLHPRGYYEHKLLPRSVMRQVLIPESFERWTSLAPQALVSYWKDRGIETFADLERAVNRPGFLARLFGG